MRRKMSNMRMIAGPVAVMGLVAALPWVAAAHAGMPVTGPRAVDVAALDRHEAVIRAVSDAARQVNEAVRRLCLVSLTLFVEDSASYEPDSKSVAAIVPSCDSPVIAPCVILSSLDLPPPVR